MRRILLFGFFIFGTAASDGVSKGEFDCWEALQRLSDCCPDHSTYPAVDCSYVRGCGTHDPDLDDDTASCIGRLSCRELQPYCADPHSAVCQ